MTEPAAGTPDLHKRQILGCFVLPMAVLAVIAAFLWIDSRPSRTRDGQAYPAAPPPPVEPIPARPGQ